MGADGTSMACPHVAGVAAMIFGIDPTFTAKEVKDIIKSTATGSYGEEGYKMLNAKLAVEKAIELRNQKAKENKNRNEENICNPPARADHHGRFCAGQPQPSHHPAEAGQSLRLSR